MSMVAFVTAMFFAGHRFSEWMWARSARAPVSELERVCSSTLFGVVFWLGATWALALAFCLQSAPLLAVATAAVLGGIALWRKTPDAAPGGAARERALVQPRTYAWVLLPIVVWVAYLLWRGYLLPPHTPDALTYHLPRAAMIAKAGGFQFFHLPDLRIDWLPASYEMLLADFLVLEGADTYTEWLNTLFFVLLLLETAALAVRWWGPGFHVYATVFLMAGVPVLLLQGAAHKNDLMAGYFLLASMRWLGRFFRERELAGCVLVILAACAAAGTKPHGLLYTALAAAAILWIAWRGRGERIFRTRHFAIAAAVAVAAFLLLGGYYYLYAAVDSLRSAKGPALTSTVMPVAYGAWAYLWQVPVLMLLAPFGASNKEVWVPWLDNYWLWERYDVHGSNFGAALSILVPLLPLLAWLPRRESDRPGLHERLFVTAIALLVALAILPTNFSPRGYVSGFPRYLLFLPAIVLGWTVSAALAKLDHSHRWHALGLASAILFTAALFVDTAFDVAEHDKFAPARDIHWAEAHPGTRWIPSMPRRAASVLDCLAGPRDSVDFHAGHDSWIYPAFGVELKRDVRFIKYAAQIRSEAQWVIVDRAYSVIWNHPDFKNIAEWKRYLGKGKPKSADLEVVETLLQDRSYKLVYHDMREVQAVFRRLPSQHAATSIGLGPDIPLPFPVDLGACSPG
jgi:hypothetical protein